MDFALLTTAPHVLYPQGEIMTEDKQPTLVGVDTEFGANADGVFLKKTQKIPQHLLDDLKDERNASCLLYTSPSPRDQRGSRMPSSA